MRAITAWTSAVAVLGLAACTWAADDLTVELRKDEARVYHDGLTRQERLERLEALEDEFKGLLKLHETPADKGLIYAELAYTWAQTGQLRPEKTVEYAKKALELIADPQARMRLYTYWGDALQLSRGPVRGKELAEVRREAAVPYLTGLKELVKLDLPEKKPEMPTFAIFNIDGPQDSPEVIEARRIMTEQSKAQARVRFQQNMIDRRETLIGQVTYLYSRSPFATEELEGLAKDVVGETKMVEKIISRVKAKIEERKAAEKGNKKAE